MLGCCLFTQLTCLMFCRTQTGPGVNPLGCSLNARSQTHEAAANSSSTALPREKSRSFSQFVPKQKFFLLSQNIRVRLEGQMKRLSVASVPLMPPSMFCDKALRSPGYGGYLHVCIFTDPAFDHYRGVPVRFLFSPRVATRELPDKPGSVRVPSVLST